MLGSDATLDERYVKKQLVEVTSTAMNRNGATVMSSIYDLSSSLAQYIERERETLVVPTWAPTLAVGPGVLLPEFGDGEDG